MCEHTTRHEGAALAAERRGCSSVEGSQRLSRFQVGKPGPGEFLACSNTPLESGNLGRSCLIEGFSVNSGVSQEAAGTRGSEIEREQIKSPPQTSGEELTLLFYRTEVATESKP